MIKLDHNATPPVSPGIFETMRPHFTKQWDNPSSSYRFGSKLKSVIETARAQVHGFGHGDITDALPHVIARRLASGLS